jgi:hypothetical protein
MKQICCIVSIFVLFSCKKEETNPPDPIVITPIQPQEPKVYSFESSPAWSDEFDVNGLPNNQIWGYDIGGGGWGNNELQNYTANDGDNARVENGKLIVTAIKEVSGSRQYSSARLVTKGKKDMKYGRLEIIKSFLYSKDKVCSGRNGLSINPNTCWSISLWVETGVALKESTIPSSRLAWNSTMSDTMP